MPRPRPVRRGPAPAAARPPKAKWGWLEWFVISQTLLPALLFLPGVSAVRTPLRVSAYVFGLVVWGVIVLKGKRARAPVDATARPWLVFAVGWLLLSLGHPNNYSVASAVAQVALYLAILSPFFWVPRVLESPGQMSRVMAILFACNALSAAVGVAQVYRPNTFNPPVIPAMNNVFGGKDLEITTADGRRILRPCGLTDTPGGAAGAGTIAAILGLCFAARPIGLLRRAACMGLGVVGVAVIYFSYIRQTLVMVVISLIAVWAFLTLRRQYAQAAQLAVEGLVALAGAMAWAVRSLGGGVYERFASLSGGGQGMGAYYMRMRGGYVTDALTNVLPANPLGYGLGWWGQINAMFGNPFRRSPVWVEVMIPAWVYDGGLPLLILYAGAVAAALYDTGRIALYSRDRAVQFWAAVVFGVCLSITATCMSFVTFLSPLGVTFWLLTALIHAADAQSRAGQGRAPARPGPRPGPKPAPRPGVGPGPAPGAEATPPTPLVPRPESAGGPA